MNSFINSREEGVLHKGWFVAYFKVLDMEHLSKLDWVNLFGFNMQSIEEAQWMYFISLNQHLASALGMKTPFKLLGLC